MGAPSFVYKLFFSNPIKNEIEKGTLNFVGIKNVRTFLLGSVPTVNDEQRKIWLQQFKDYAKSL